MKLAVHSDDKPPYAPKRPSDPTERLLETVPSTINSLDALTK